MPFRSFLMLMALSTAGAWIAWAVVINAIDPTKSGAMGFVLFYGSLTIALFGTLAVGGVLVRLWLNKAAIPARVTVNASRQAILLTTLVTGALLLFSQGWFRWWTSSLSVLIVALIELLFQSRRPEG